MLLFVPEVFTNLTKLVWKPLGQLFLCFLCFFYTYVNAATESTYFDVAEPFIANVGSEDNFPNGLITSIKQDSNGDMWFGTYDGLVRFDSIEFTTYKYDPQDSNSISGNLITHINPDEEGGIWVSTYSTGLTYLNNNKNIIRKYFEKTELQDGLASNVVMTTLLDGDNLWVGTRKGLNVINLLDNSIRFYDYSLENNGKSGGINSLVKDNQGKLWVGTTKGLFYADQEKELIIPVLTPSIKNKVVYRLHYSNNKLWIGTQKSGLAYMDLTTQEINWLLSPQSEESNIPWVMDFAQVSETELWVASFGGGIVIVDPTTNEISKILQHHKDGKTDLVSNDTSSLFISEDNNLWIGFWGEYTQRINQQLPFIRTFNTTQFNLVDDSIDAIVALSNNTLLLGNRQLLEVTIDKLKLKVTPILKVEKALNKDTITALAQSKNGDIWVGTRQSGLFQFDHKYTLLNHYSNENGFPHSVIRYIVPSIDGGVWIGANGISKWLPHRGFKHYQVPNANLQSESMLETSDGTLWVASFGQLFRIQPDKTQLELIIENVSEAHSLAGNVINCIVQDKNGNLYLLTNSRVFSVILKQDTPSHIELTKLYKDFHIDGGRNIVIDHSSNLWTEKEFIDATAQTKTKFSRKDGIDIGTALNGGKLLTRDQEIFFVGTKGLMIINPNIPKPKEYKSKTYITNIAIDGKSKSGSNSPIVVAPENTEIIFELNAKNFSSPSSMQYNYSLSGYIDDWKSISFKQRYVTFRDLPPGEYTFIAEAENLDSGQTTIKTSQKLVLIPHWYETIWFQIVVIICIIGLFWLGHSIRIRLVEKLNKELKLLVQARTKELEDKNAQIENLANHDVLTSLPNLRLALDRLTEAMKRSKREKTLTAVVYFDLDGFKPINDTYGHQAGDFVLQSVGERVSKLIRETDTLCRIGGDEFLLILENITDRSMITNTCERILNAFKESITWEHNKLFIKMSIGVAIYPGHATTPKELIKRADDLMYEVKRSGKFHYKIDEQ